MQITGNIKEIFEAIHVSESFKKREFVIEVVDGQYSEVIKLEFIQDKCAILDQYQVVSEVTVDFNLKGRKWVNPQGEVKYFNTLQAWKISANASNPYSAEVGNNSEIPDSSTPPPIPESGFKVGDLVNYHSVIGGAITSEGHKIESISMPPNNYGGPVAWISGKSGCVSLDALSKAGQNPPPMPDFEIESEDDIPF